MSDWEHQIVSRANTLLDRAVRDQDRVERRREGSFVPPMFADDMRWSFVREALGLLKKIEPTKGE